MTFNQSYRKYNNGPQHTGQSESVLENVAEKQLPMDLSKEAFLESVRNNASTVLIGETGSGKTTCTPAHLLEAFPDAKIAFTSPRVLPALTVSEYVAEKRGQKVGQDIGVITRQEANVSDDTRLTFMTDGVLLSMFKKDPLLMEFDIVAIDEAHERSLNIDLSLGLLKDAQKKRKAEGKKELKIIIASATIEEEKFVTYFDGVPPLKVPGRMYPVDIVYSPLENDSRGGVETEYFAAAKVTKKIISSGEEGDILIFMPGEQEIGKTVNELEQIIGNDDSFEILPLYGSLQKNEQKKVFTKNGKRKIIVSTNIAETSVTIPGVRHVIDTGTVKQKNYNPDTGIDELKLIETSQANMNQRMGRAGRTAPGTCYRLMGKEDFESREEFQKSEIKRANLGETVLRMKDMGIDDVEGFDFIESPSKESLRDALVQLYKLGALDDSGKITEMGKEMAHLEMRPDLSRMLVEAKHQECLPLMVDLCSMISANKPVMIQGKTEKAKTHEEAVAIHDQMMNQQKLKVPESDFLTLLQIWKKWTDSGYNGRFAYDHLLNVQALKDIGLTRGQLLKNLANSGMPVDYNEDAIDVSKMLKCLYSGASDAIMFSEDGGRSYYPFTNDPARNGAQIFPGSSVFKAGGNLIFAFNVSRAEKMVTDKNTGVQVKRNNLWAKTCHKLTLDDVKTLAPGSVVEKKEGDMYRSYYGSFDYHQAYGVYVFGKRIDVIHKPVEGYVPPSENSYYNPSLYRESRVEQINFVATPGDIAELFPEIYTANIDIINKVRDYQSRSNEEILFSVDQEDLLVDTYSSYREAILKFNIKTKEDVLEHKNDFRLHLEDFLSDEERARIDLRSPKEIVVNGKVFSVTYTVSVGKKIAKVLIKKIEDVGDFLQVQLPSFEGRNEVTFSLSHTQPQVINHNARYSYFGNNPENELVFCSVKELRDYYDQYQKSEEKKKRRHERKETERSEVSVPSIRIVEEIRAVPSTEKTIERKEKVEAVALDISDIRNLLLYFRGITQEKNIRELKDKDKILERIKEISRRSVEITKEMENKKEISLGNGEMSELLQSVRAIAKRIGISPSQAEQLPFVYKHNEIALAQSAKRNEVDIDEILLKKITAKSLDFALEKNAVFTDDEADEILIDLV